MNQTEFLSELTKWLYLKQVPDVEDIMLEYRQHFAFNLADGYSEEEIAARLGNPKELANQFNGEDLHRIKQSGRAVAAGGVILVDVFACLLGVLLAAWVVVLGAATITFGVTAICLILQWNIQQLIPYMPYICRLFYGVSFIALTVLSTLATWYCFLFFRQLMRCYLRWRRNVLASVRGGAILPPLSVYPAIENALRRRMRSVALIAVIAFGVGFVVAYILSSALAGSLQFWHVWNWFVA
jgi:uncharacterized membrane protein